MLQAELESEHPGVFALFGVNEAGSEMSASVMADRGDIGLLQDTPMVDAWTAWSVTYRDVIVLDADGRRAGVYNLTTHDLRNPDEYAEMKALLLQAAGL